MGALEIVLGIVIIVFAVALVFLVLKQSGKDKRLSGSIAGGAETFFGKSKGKTEDRLLSRLTTVLAFVFAIVAVVMYIVISKIY